MKLMFWWKKNFVKLILLENWNFEKKSRYQVTTRMQLTRSFDRCYRRKPYRFEMALLFVPALAVKNFVVVVVRDEDIAEACR